MFFTLLAAEAAADTAAEKRAAAQALFEDARRLVSQGNHEAACPKFRESQALDPGIGTLYNLGECLEAVGKTAGAWAAFHEAADMARIADQSDREVAARNRAIALEPKLMRLAVEVPPDAIVDGLVIERNGVEVGRGQWGVAVPVDPGAHIIVVRAPGKKSRELTVAVDAAGTTRTVRVEPLEDDASLAVPPPPPAAQPPSTTAEEPPQQHDIPTTASYDTWGLVLTGVGVVGLGLGGVLALDAKSKYDDSLAFCETSDPNRCDSEGVSLRDDARSRGNLATVAVGLGAVALAGGIVILVSTPEQAGESAASIETGPMIGRDSAAWTMRGTW